MHKRKSTQDKTVFKYICIKYVVLNNSCVTQYCREGVAKNHVHEGYKCHFLEVTKLMIQRMSWIAAFVKGSRSDLCRLVSTQ